MKITASTFGIFLATSLFLATTPSYAEGVELDALHPFRMGLLFDLGYGKLDSSQARSKLIGDSGFSPTVTLQADVFDLLSLAASAGTVFVDDNAEFEQGVVSLAGQESTAESTLNTNVLGLAAGLRTPALRLAAPDRQGLYPATWVFARYGKSWQSASRSIANCGDCDSEDIDLGDGNYLDTGALVGILGGPLPIGLLLGCGYRRYFDASAVRYTLTGTLGMSFF
jgi:hypothetical protein